MNRLKPLTLILFIYISAVAVYGDSLTLNLKDAWAKMEAANSDLKKLQIQWGAAVRTAGSHDQLLPSLSASAGLKRSSPLVSAFTSGDSFDERDNWSISGALNMSLKLTPGLSTEGKIRQLNADLLALQIDQKTRELKYNLTVLYYDILGGQQRIALQKANLNLSEARLKQTEQKYKQGLASDLDLLSSRLSAVRDQPGLEKEQSAQEKRLITLRGYLGLDDSTEITLAPETVDMDNLPDKDKAVSASASSVDLRILEDQIQLAKLKYELAKKGAYGPSLTTALGWSSGINPLFQADSWTAQSWADSLSFGLTLSVPLDSHFKGSSDQLTLKGLDEAIKIAEINLDAARKSLQDKVRSLYLDMDLSRTNIKMDTLNVSLLEQTYNKMEQGYNSGTVSQADLDDSRQNWKEAVLTLEEEKQNLSGLTLQLYHLLNKD